jgi:hypothetical protein
VGEGGGRIKVYPPSKIFAKLDNKITIKHKKVYPPKKIFTTPIYPLSQNLSKTSWTLPLDFQTVSIYASDSSNSLKQSRLDKMSLLEPNA